LNELRKLKRIIGKPRRFSPVFCKNERYRLEQYRFFVRSVHRKDDKSSQFSSFSAEGIPECLKRGSRVSAFSPKSNFVHEAIIISQESNGYTVKFFHEDLGTAVLPDELVMVCTFI
jgi:hypothetical protein